jgi:hypothetical protein
MKPEERAAARALRREGRSIGSIAAQVGVAKSSVSRWVAGIELSAAQHAVLASSDPLHPRRTNGAAAKRAAALQARRRGQASGRAAALAGDPLHAVGCALFWAEGSKGRNSVTLTNSDPELVATFLRFLRECFAVPDGSCRASTARSRPTAAWSGRRGWPDAGGVGCLTPEAWVA